MKIALIRARYNPYGGAERFALRAMQALGDAGIELTIIARRWHDAAEDMNPSPPGRGAGVREGFEGSRQPKLLRCDPFYLGSLWRDWSFARAVRHTLQHQTFDLVQSHERIPGLPIYRAGDGVHAVWLERRGATMNGFKRWLMHLNPHHRWLLATERKMFEHLQLQAVICNSHMVRDEIFQRFNIAEHKLRVIPNGVDLERFHPCARDLHREAMRKQLDLGSNVPVFVLVGSGFERKGVATALRALASLHRQQASQAILVIVGSDKHIARYQSLAQHLGVYAHTRFVGEQRDPLPYYGMADAFLLPTLYDPFPNAALEALACGLPIIVSEACGAKEAIKNPDEGYVCPVNAPEAYAHAMQAIVLGIGNPVQATALKNAARHAAMPYDLAAMGESLQGLYRSLYQARLGQRLHENDTSS